MTGDELDVRADGEHVYAVTVRSSGRALSYRVQVPESLLDQFNLTRSDEPLLVREALELLLALPGSAMPAEFSLDQAEVSYPGFLEQLASRAER